MKKFVSLLTCVILCVSFLVTVCSAHPGGTDSNGGHTDHSTGEYHYHHGYSAHQHNPTCPYAYNNNTGISSGSSGSYISSSNSGTSITQSFDSYDEGYDAGYREGYSFGYKFGKSEDDDEIDRNSYNKGYRQGESEGYDSGYNKGNEDGYILGYDEGKVEGYEAGKNEAELQIYEIYKARLILLGICALIFSAVAVLITGFLTARFCKTKEKTETINVCQQEEIVQNTLFLKPDKKQYSGFIDEYWYKNGSLYIKMKNGSTYRYKNVPVSVYEQMTNAESIGALFYSKINGLYEYETIEKRK